MKRPNLSYELEYRAQGCGLIAGLDEVGMGCLAGPVVAAAVIFDLNDVPRGLNDSKLIPEKTRKKLAAEVEKRARAFAIGWASVAEIDSINILQAARLAMKRAVESLAVQPDHLLIDGRSRIDLPLSQLSIIKGDQKSVSIAAASIVAKVYRDQWMTRLDLEYGGYEFSKHKGYGSREHRLNLQRLGPSPIHRKSFSWTPVLD